MDQKVLIAALRIVAAEIELKLMDWGDKLDTVITKEEAIKSGGFEILAVKNGKDIAFVRVYKEGNDWYVYDVEVNENFRRKGIATKMYDYADDIVGNAVKPQVLDSSEGEPPMMTKEAFDFWKKRDPYLVDDITDAVEDLGGFSYKR